jgi:hypothetical protein
MLNSKDAAQNKRRKNMKGIVACVVLGSFLLAGVWVGCSDKQKAEREAYQNQIEAKLKGAGQKIDELRARAAEIKEDMKEEFNQQMEELKKKQEMASKKSDELKASSGKAWEDIKSGMEAAVEDLDQAYQKALSRFK